MSSHSKALEKAKGKISNLVKDNEGKVDDKGKKPKKEFGAKNNDSQEN